MTPFEYREELIKRKEAVWQMLWQAKLTRAATAVKAKTSALTGSLARCIASYWGWLIKNLSDIITLYTKIT